MDNFLVYFGYILTVILCFCVLAIDRKCNRLEDRLANTEAISRYLWTERRAEKTVENITDGVEA